MKIEETPYGFSNPAIEKIKRSAQGVDALLDDFSLSFLDLLTSAADQAERTPAVASESSTAKAKETAKPEEKPTEDTADKARLSLVQSVPKTETLQEAAVTRVEKDMMLLNTELTDVDQQYLKQVVIPNVPILLGSVPFESVFPVDESGNISYQGFEISPKLSELIEKGYKTGRPIRVELDPHSAVVLKIRNGQVSAEFVSADRTAATIMQQELDQLRNRMISKNLPVGSLEYKYRDPSQSHTQQDDDAQE